MSEFVPQCDIVPRNPKTYHAIVLSLQERYFTAYLLRSSPRLRQYPINELRNSVCAHVDRPRQISHSIVLDNVSQVTPAQRKVSAGVPDTKVDDSNHTGSPWHILPLRSLRVHHCRYPSRSDPRCAIRV